MLTAGATAADATLGDGVLNMNMPTKIPLPVAVVSMVATFGLGLLISRVDSSSSANASPSVPPPPSHKSYLSTDRGDQKIWLSLRYVNGMDQLREIAKSHVSGAT